MQLLGCIFIRSPSARFQNGPLMEESLPSQQIVGLGSWRESKGIPRSLKPSGVQGWPPELQCSVAAATLPAPWGGAHSNLA